MSPRRPAQPSIPTKASRRWPVGLALLLALACSTPDDEPGDTVAPDDAPDGLCDARFVVDGRFSNWPTEVAGPCWEWEATTPREGVLGAVYLDWDGETLRLLHDWHPRTEAKLADDERVRVALTTGGGQEQWVVHIQGTGAVHVIRNGAAYGAAVAAAVGFHASPLSATPHVIAELALDVLPGVFTLAVWGPPNPGSGGDADGQAREPRIWTGYLHASEGQPLGEVDAFAHQGPVLAAILPPSGVSGDSVTLHGLGFGAEGTVAFDGDDAQVGSWSSDTVVVTVPAIAQDRSVVVSTPTGPTNPLRFFYDCQSGCEGAACAECPPDVRCAICPHNVACVQGFCSCQRQCAGRDCGSDGCGGVCGICKFGDFCAGGLCQCKLLCGPENNCGSDGCGSVCGVCGAGAQCILKKCCTPQCAGKQCGDNGCGGSCGTCGEGFSCSGTACVCKPTCDDKQCGPNGCGGECGTCVKGFQCLGGYCKCVPSCVNQGGVKMECGDDGCGGSCGLCEGGLQCTKIGICVPDDD